MISVLVNSSPKTEKVNSLINLFAHQLINHEKGHK